MKRRGSIYLGVGVEGGGRSCPQAPVLASTHNNSIYVPVKQLLEQAPSWYRKMIRQATGKCRFFLLYRNFG